jgi:hypothetical protein
MFISFAQPQEQEEKFSRKKEKGEVGGMLWGRVRGGGS